MARREFERAAETVEALRYFNGKRYLAVMTLASAFKVESHPIHDRRCDLGWREAMWWCQELDIERLVWRPPPPNVRRRAYS